MNGCHTDCLEKPLSRGFGSLGKLIARYPWWFIVVPVALSVGSGVGFCFLEQRQIMISENQFPSTGSPLKIEGDFIRTHFPMNETEHFSTLRLYNEGSFASIIIVGLSQNLLNESNFEELQRLDTAVRSLSLDSEIHFQNLCAQINDSTCFSANPLLALIQNGTRKTNMTYPMFQNSVFLGKYIGGVTLGPDNTLLQAQALRFVYYLREDTDRERVNSAKWLNYFISSFPQQLQMLQLKSFQVYYYTSISVQKQLEEDAKRALPFFTVTFIVTILFSVLSCMRLHSVRNKIWVALFGVISPGLAILTSFGLLLFCGAPFAITAVNAPFLILGAGMDNMFIIISCWQQTKIRASLEERMAETYQEAAVSITITTLTDVLAFYIGIMTHFPSVQSFCIYTGTALVFCYLYCITFFGAVLALNGRLENDNRHWLICVRVKDAEESAHNVMHQMCCLGGSFETSGGTEIEHPVTVFFHKYYGVFLTNQWTKVLTVLLYLGYLAISIYGCFKLQGGVDVQKLPNDNSYVSQYYANEALYFAAHGPRIMVVVNSELEYWKPKTSKEIETCMQKLENNSYVDKKFTESWLRTYEGISKALNVSIITQDGFMDNLDIIFAYFASSKQDVDVEGNKIKASRFFVQTINLVGTIDERNMATQLRGIAASCNIPVFVYHPIFICLDRYALIIQSAIQNIIVAVVVMLVVSLLFIPNPLCSLWVTFAIASIIVGVAGFMAFWKVDLDSISLITLVICIGFSVDFSSHIAYAWFSSKKEKPEERVIDALHVLGYPIVQGALSTILGVVALSVAESYIFKTFFKLTCLVIAFGVLHGLVFIPVFLTMIVCPKWSRGSKVKPQKISHQPADTMAEPKRQRENQIKKEDLPGYPCSVPDMINTGIPFTTCYYLGWKRGVFTIFHPEKCPQEK
ncbi:patched domain-containing protein 3 [Xenopus laevis]|uniref:Patched domain-containing protein 3 n=1 Tax=Xenopus laevis TaxID=8355 RepID=A0A8J1L3V6_XENLA|nr:patched domain-containing protein 3 [Xenopus laevis]